jgi:hypothetical protein
VNASGLIYNDDGEDITMDALTEAVEQMPDPTLLDMVKVDVLRALREQSSEAMAHLGEPGYSRLDLLRDGRAFADVADWLDDHWAEIVTPTEEPA